VFEHAKMPTSMRFARPRTRPYWFYTLANASKQRL